MSEILYPEQIKYLESFRVKADPLIEEMELYAGNNSVPILSYHASQFLQQIVLIKQPVRVLEIGTAIAYSAINIARHLPDDGVVDTIEISAENAETAKSFIKKSGLENKINIITGDALVVIPQLKSAYDLIFLDADKHIYVEAFEKSIRILNKNGVVFIDNLLWHGYAASEDVPESYKKSTQNIREFNNYFMSLKDFHTAILPIGDGIGLGIKL